MRLKAVEARDGHVLAIEWEDGSKSFFDMKPYLDYPAFTPLRNDSEFRSILNRGYYVEWSSGADLSVDTLAARSMDYEELKTK